MPQSCETCRHWKSENSNRGQCRYSPPRSQLVLVGTGDPELRAIWPLTSATDCCGAWNNPSMRQGTPSRSSSAASARGAADVA